MNLHTKLAQIQKELKAPKGQFNKFGSFYYRNQEDILEAVKPLLKDIVLNLSDEIVIVGDRYYVKATACIKDESGEISTVAYAREPENKTGMDQAQLTGATSSYARKYALNGLFAIDDSKDADFADNTQSATTAPKKQDKQLELGTAHTSKCENCGTGITTQEKSYSKLKFSKGLCRPCQLKEIK